MLRFARNDDGGIVPVFYLNARQEMKIAPLMDPRAADYAQETSGGPYFYADLTVTLLKYAFLALLYEYSKLDYKAVDFDDQFKWLASESKISVLETGSERASSVGWKRLYQDRLWTYL